MPCKAPAHSRVPTCPGPAGQPAHLRCQRCARGLCEAPGDKFDRNCYGTDARQDQRTCVHCSRKKNFRSRRGSIINLVAAGNTTGTGLQQAWTQRVDTIAEDLFGDCLVGEIPCGYAFCLAGSGARHEASPYSDLDCFILVDDPSPAKIDFFVRTCEGMRSAMTVAEGGNSGLRFCNIMSPFGSPGDPKAPPLIRTPHDMAALVEMSEDRVHSHISGGLQEHRFLFGNRQLYDDFKIDLNVIVAKTCRSFSSRPFITRRKKMGLKVIKETVESYKAPKATDTDFHVKEQFYRPPQFLAKGLAWYYGIDEVGTAAQLRALVQSNNMSQTTANNFMTVMDAMAQLRFKLHLDAEGEKDFVYLDRQKRESELAPLRLLNQHQLSQDQKLRKGRLESGTLLSPGDVQPLIKSISNLNYIVKLGREFVAQKEKLLGKRRNPFNA